MQLVGIANENEFYSDNYLSEIFSDQEKSHRKNRVRLQWHLLSP